MFEKLISMLGAYVNSLQNRTKATQLHDEALAHYISNKYKNAFPIMREAAQLGEKNAMALLGSMYLLGQGTYENGDEALKWLHKAVASGQTDAMGVLGMSYATGKGDVKKNRKLALEFLNKAAQSGDKESVKMLNMIQKKKGMFRHDK